jgi:hypothetical protein
MARKPSKELLERLGMTEEELPPPRPFATVRYNFASVPMGDDSANQQKVSEIATLTPRRGLTRQAIQQALKNAGIASTPYRGSLRVDASTVDKATLTAALQAAGIEHSISEQKNGPERGRD